MKIIDLFEMPIANFHHVGDFSKNSSFRQEQDRKLLTNPKALQKIKGMWKFPEETMFNIILVNHPDGSRHTEVGEVSHDWCEANFPRIWDQLEPLLNDQQVNVIFTNNKGDERVPMTGWIMAHRLGHCFLAQQQQSPSYYMLEANNTFSRYIRTALENYGIEFNTELRDYRQSGRYGYSLRDFTRNGPSLGFLREICTFRAARENNIRNPSEVVLELLAQYMTTGRIKFNDWPRNFRYGRNYYGYRGSQEEFEQDSRMFAQDCAHELEGMFNAAISYAEGNIYVM